MTNAELIAMPHATAADLDAIPSITLRAIAGMPSFCLGLTVRVFDAVETADGWDGCQRNPRTGHFVVRQSFSRANYELVP